MKVYTVQVMRAWAFIAILLGTLVLFFGSMVLLRVLDLPRGLFLVLGGVCLFGGYRLIKKAAIVAKQVTLTPAHLTIHNSGRAHEQQIMLADVASFLYQEFNGNKTLRLRLNSGQKVSLTHNDTFCPDDDIESLAADFTKQVADSSADQQANIKREKTFFEKPLANVVGWLVLAGLSYFSWHLLQHGVKDGKWGSVCMVYGNGLTYLGAWFAARRTKPEAN
jgi:hypothetical protein